MTQNQDVYVRAYSLLSSLRENIGRMTNYSITEKYVREYHTVLDRLEGIGIDVSDFRVPDSEVEPRIMAVWNGGQSYSDEKYVERSFILTKIDAILVYFKIITSKPPRTIGFTPPEK